MLTTDHASLSEPRSLRSSLPFSDAESSSRRRYKRVPFFQPAKIRRETGKEVIAFTRDISRVGIGLIHDVPLSNHNGTMYLCNQNMEVEVSVSMSKPSTDGWYTSYGQFVGLTRFAAKKLFVATALRKLDPRSIYRHPFFGPAKLSTTAPMPENLSVFTRDISLSAVGLFHNKPLDKREVLINVPGSDESLRAKIKSCKPCGFGWHVSSAAFDRASSRLLCRNWHS